MIGRRRDDARIEDLQAGDYSVRSHSVWARLPNGELSRIPVGDGAGWSLTEHEDGTVTLDPSILLTAPNQPEKSWHGWLRAGVWSEA